jgi:hypothetical protein
LLHFKTAGSEKSKQRRNEHCASANHRILLFREV